MQKFYRPYDQSTILLVLLQYYNLSERLSGAFVRYSIFEF